MADTRPKLSCKLLTSTAKCPTQAHSEDAGYDLYAAINEDYVIPPCGKNTIPVGIALAIPKGWYGRIAGRSGLASKYGINVLGGVVDSGYRGEISVILHNTDNFCSFTVTPGMKIAQMIIEKHLSAEFVLVDDLDLTERAENGFGSTGK